MNDGADGLTTGVRMGGWMCHMDDPRGVDEGMGWTLGGGIHRDGEIYREQLMIS
jgi:hypothetical protein